MSNVHTLQCQPIPGACAEKWKQCGGLTKGGYWPGPHCCWPGTTCLSWANEVCRPALRGVRSQHNHKPCIQCQAYFFLAAGASAEVQLTRGHRVRSMIDVNTASFNLYLPRFSSDTDASGLLYRWGSFPPVFHIVCSSCHEEPIVILPVLPMFLL